MFTAHVHTEGMLEGSYFDESLLHLGLSLTSLALTLLHSRIPSSLKLKCPQEEGGLQQSASLIWSSSLRLLHLLCPASWKYRQQSSLFLLGRGAVSLPQRTVEERLDLGSGAQ